LIVGNIEKGKLHVASCFPTELDVASRVPTDFGDTEIAPTGDAYILLLLTTKKGYMAMTNPIWVAADVRD